MHYLGWCVVGNQQGRTVADEGLRGSCVLLGPQAHHVGLVGINTRTATGVGEDQGTEPVRVAQRKPGGDYAAPGHAQHDGPVHVRVVQ